MSADENVSYWEKKYAAGHQQRYPWDSVVSFVFRHAPRDRPRGEVKVLELGCGTASNLWFAAREGFSVTGVEFSASALETARKRFSDDNLSGDFIVGDFSKLPLADRTFDLVIDRGSLTCATYDQIARAVEEVGRVAKPGAFFFFNPYADSHSSFHGSGKTTGRTVQNVDVGSLEGLAQITFLSASDMKSLLAADWTVQSLQRVEVADMAEGHANIHAEWRAIARRT